MLNGKTLRRIREKVEAWMVAAAFAEAGATEAAMEAMDLRQKEQPEARERLRRERLRRLRAPQMGL